MSWEADFGDLLDESVIVAPFLGTGARGDVWGPETPVTGVQIDESYGMTRSADSTDRPIVARLALSQVYAALFPPGSKVTLPSGKVGTVMSNASARQSALGWRFQQVVIGS